MREARDRQELWNRAEAAERQWNGRPARNIVVAFPTQFDQQQREWMLKDFVREAFVRKGMVADVNMHAPHHGGDNLPCSGIGDGAEPSLK